MFIRAAVKSNPGWGCICLAPTGNELEPLQQLTGNQKPCSRLCTKLQGTRLSSLLIAFNLAGTSKCAGRVPCSWLASLDGETPKIQLVEVTTGMCRIAGTATIIPHMLPHCCSNQHALRTQPKPVPSTTPQA